MVHQFFNPDWAMKIFLDTTATKRRSQKKVTKQI